MLFLTKKIVCPTDFSEPARKGVDAAVELAEKFSAELILVHVITLTSLRPASLQRSTYLKRRKEIAQEAMAQLIAEAVPSQIKCRSQIIGEMRVRAADAIVELAEEAAADLIVLASHGQSGWGRIFFGSVAESVVRLSICPVLTVKRPTRV
jgi:nucleotide-binding universal stress UspA family protein